MNKGWETRGYQPFTEHFISGCPEEKKSKGPAAFLQPHLGPLLFHFPILGYLSPACANSQGQSHGYLLLFLGTAAGGCVPGNINTGQAGELQNMR